MSLRPTLQDIATAAGVAASTVCRALRNDRRIPASTQERIREIAENLGYRPDPLLSALSLRRQGKSGSAEITTIAYIDNNRGRILGEQEYGFREACWAGAKTRAEELGYRLEAFHIGNRELSERRLSQILYTRGIIGVCIAPLVSARGHLKLDWEKFACAAIGYTLVRPSLHRAAAHHYQSILLALREMRRLGYQRIAVFLDEATSRRVDDIWLAGVLLYARRYPKMHFPVLVKSGSVTDPAFCRMVVSWYRKQKPDAIIGNTAFRRILEAEGIRFPQDAAYAGLYRIHQYDGLIACVDQRTEQIAGTAIDLVIEQIQKNERGIPISPKTVLVTGQWQPGSSAQPKSRSRL